jgi:hypothetical protein
MGVRPQSDPTPVHFMPNSHAFWSNQQHWTTSYGPAYADILLQPSNFVPCPARPLRAMLLLGTEFRLEDLSCTLTPDGKYANCQYFDIPYGIYFVDINRDSQLLGITKARLRNAALTAADVRCSTRHRSANLCIRGC